MVGRTDRREWAVPHFDLVLELFSFSYCFVVFDFAGIVTFLWASFLHPPALSVALFRNKFVILSEWCFRITPTNEHEWIWMNMKIIWNIEILKIVPVIRPSPSPISHTPTLHSPHSTHSRLLSSSRVFEQFIFTIYNSHAFFGLSRSLPAGPSSGVGLWMYDGECRMSVSVQSIVGLAGWAKDIQWQKWNRK